MATSTVVAFELLKFNSSRRFRFVMGLSSCVVNYDPFFLRQLSLMSSSSVLPSALLILPTPPPLRTPRFASFISNYCFRRLIIPHPSSLRFLSRDRHFLAQRIFFFFFFFLYIYLLLKCLHLTGHAL